MTNWRDIQERAAAFALRWEGKCEEEKYAAPFWIELMALYGIDQNTVGSFQSRVKVYGKPGVGKIDYFAPRRFLIEQKSCGEDLKKAYLQALAYFDGLPQEERPRHIVVCDFETIRVYDLEARGKRREIEFLVKDLTKHVKKLAFLLDKEEQEYEEEKEINVKAVRAVGKLHGALRASNYSTEHTARLLTQLVFCFFADDVGIFEQHSIRRYIEENTREDGLDLGPHLTSIFTVLATRKEARPTTLHPALAALPYVNGGLFDERSPVFAVGGSSEIRDTLLACLAFDWSDVSPAIFGSMFQSVLDTEAGGTKRHDLGAHYTSEENIMKVIGPLFLDALREELEKAKSESALKALWDKVAAVTLLDPACGCGNFLVVAYRELRALELEIITRIDSGKKGTAGKVEKGQAHFGLPGDFSKISRMSVERMYGIEIEPFAAEVARLSLWLVDQMAHLKLGAYYGTPVPKLPLTEAPHIVRGNALLLDWEFVVPKEKLTHILGNPPFLGSKIMSDEQRAEIRALFGEGGGVLDYVSGWYLKAAEFIKDTSIGCAFVSTNSITQGEQPAILWKTITEKFGMHTHFAHRTFKWTNEAKGKAAVYCVVIGFGAKRVAAPRLFDYPDIAGAPIEIRAKHINAYLADAPEVFIESRSKPLCGVPEIRFGNQPIDGGLLSKFSNEDKTAFLAEEPSAEKFFKQFVGADEFLNGGERWCLWMRGADPSEIRNMPRLLRQISLVKDYREGSKRKETVELAATPALFAFVSHPDSDYIIIPSVSSERRRYVPMGFMSKEVIASNLCLMVPNATLYHFGVLESEMHMAWMRAVCGRLESRYRYSNSVVYNNFPWPESPTEAQKKKVEECAQAVLDARAAHPRATLADLYDPNTMPKNLLDAHRALDRAVDACYGTRAFKDEPSRLEFLFERYKRLTSGA